MQPPLGPADEANVFSHTHLKPLFILCHFPTAGYESWIGGNRYGKKYLLMVWKTKVL
jgi:hypothetical protein